MDKKVPTPNELCLKSKNIRNNWKLFKQQWSNYEIASGLNKEEQEIRTATFLTVVGSQALEVYNTFQWDTEEEKTQLEVILKKFEYYCLPKVNITYERYLFNSRKQNENESIDEYVTALRSLAENCDFGSLKESLIRDIMILGLKEDRLREILLRECDLKLENALNIARSSERARRQFEVIAHKKESSDFSVNNISRKFKETNKSDKTNKKSKGCWFCGQFHIFGDRTKCPAYGKTCDKCNKKNHFAKVCQMKTNFEIGEEEDEEDINNMEELYIE